ncbi:MAG: hypothetical protein EOM21_13085 [Gammaproteobacteria bacterium]|nr:hypothetical protein [Gammaproteobacteria bacterium]
MQVRVNADREQAILAGHDRYGSMVVGINPAELGDEDRAALAAAPEVNGVIDLTALTWGYRPNAPKPPCSADADPLAWLAWRRVMQAFETACRKEEAAQFDQELAAYLDWARAQPAEAFLEWSTPSHERVRLPRPPGGAPRLPDRLRWLDPSRDPEQRAREGLAEQWAAAEELLATREGERQARREAEAAEQAAKATRRQEQLAAWVGSIMNENAQGRFQRGVLAESEIMDAIAEETFAPLDEFPRYVPIASELLGHDETCDEREMDCRVGPANDLGVALTHDQYARFLKIERMATELLARPESTRVDVTPYAQVCACSECDAELSRVAARVTVHYGELTVSRAYGLDLSPEEEAEIQYLLGF